MMRRKRKITAVFLSVMMVVLTACGNNNQADAVMAMAPINDTKEQTEEIEENTRAKASKAISDAARLGVETAMKTLKEKVEEKAEEEAETVPYAEANELVFNDELSVETKAVRTNVNDETDMEVADAVWTLKSITIEDGEEEGTQVITVESECTSYYWTDRKNRQMYSIVLPSVRGFDVYTGECFPSATKTGDMELGFLTEVTWGNVTYQIDATGHSEWDDDGDWAYDEKSGGYIHPTVVHYEDKFVIEPQGYDSLGLVIEPVVLADVEDREDGVREDENVLIKDVLDAREGCYLYSVMDMYTMLNEDSVDEDKGNTSTNAETQKESTTTNNSSTTPKQDTSTNGSGSKENTTPKQEQPTHTHNYTSSVTKNPTCSEEGVRLYSCSCGDSYTEAIAKVDHNWQPITESVYHPSTGHYETVTKKEVYCGCGATFSSQSELNAHWESGCPSQSCGVYEQSYNEWVVDQPEYYSDEVTGYQCSVCGARQ